MPLLKDGKLIEDTYHLVEDGDDMPEEGAIVVTLERWEAEKEQLSMRNAPLGLKLKSDQAPDQIKDDLDMFDVVLLDFPAFTDGRSYSHARLLKERYGYKGELRATGDVLRDQLFYMYRCGFDTFDLADDRSVGHWDAALTEFSGVYQPATRGPEPIMSQRHRPKAA